MLLQLRLQNFWNWLKVIVGQLKNTDLPEKVFSDNKAILITLNSRFKGHLDRNKGAWESEDYNITPNQPSVVYSNEIKTTFTC